MNEDEAAILSRPRQRTTWPFKPYDYLPPDVPPTLPLLEGIQRALDDAYHEGFHQGREDGAAEARQRVARHEPREGYC